MLAEGCEPRDDHAVDLECWQSIRHRFLGLGNHGVDVLAKLFESVPLGLRQCIAHAASERLGRRKLRGCDRLAGPLFRCDVRDRSDKSIGGPTDLEPWTGSRRMGTRSAPFS